MNVQRVGFDSPAARSAGARPAVEPSSGFAEKLEKAKSNLVFSAHARSRLESRHIELTDEMIGKLDTAVKSAARKGSRDSLVLLSNLAFIVNVPNRTVVTAMDGTAMKEHIITNIDSTVIAG